LYKQGLFVTKAFYAALAKGQTWAWTPAFQHCRHEKFQLLIYCSFYDSV